MVSRGFSISIHTLHTEGDIALVPLLIFSITISIHTLHTEGDEIKYGTSKKYKGFQSTPSTRRVTRHMYGCHYPIPISIHTLHTEGDKSTCGLSDKSKTISIHTLHTEGDFGGKAGA